jgi:hypothetical protein
LKISADKSKIMSKNKWPLKKKACFSSQRNMLFDLVPQEGTVVSRFNEPFKGLQGI